jgi:hypothetical protein
VERIILDSKLDRFILIDEIVDADSSAIAGRKQFDHAPLYLGIESLAQLGAYHVRFLTDFEKHAFLLGVKHCDLPTANELHGPFRIFGNLLARGSSAYSYRLGATGNEGVKMAGEFLFGVMAYDDGAFKTDILREHYRKVFSCLRNSSRTDC